MAWWNSPLERRSIQTEMRVWTLQGARLGRVRLIGKEVMYVRPSRLSRREVAVPLGRVARVTGRGVYVAGAPSEVCEPVGDRLRHDIPTHIHPLAEPLQAMPVAEPHGKAASGTDLWFKEGHVLP